MDSSNVDNEDILSGEGDDIMETNEDTFTTSTTQPKKKARKGTRAERSIVWELFEKLPLTDDNILRAKCKGCDLIYRADSKNGIGTLRRHMKKCPKTKSRDVGQMLISGGSGSMALRSSKFDPNHFRELVASAIVMHDLPFQFVEYDGIRAYFEYLYSNTNCVSRNTIKSDVLKMYTREKVRMKSLLKSCPGRICFTSYCWSSITTDGYLSLTGHFIDNDWSLQKRVLNFSFFPPPHTGSALCDKIIELFREWEIEDKIFSLTLDNASANDVSAEKLKEHFMDILLENGKFFHIRCCAHIVNLVVHEGLKDIDKSVHKVRESVKYVRGSQSRKQTFLEQVSFLKLDSKKGLRQDVATRWNSTYHMLESALIYQRAFFRLASVDTNYLSCPDASEWKKIEKICEFLSIFNDISNVFSGTLYPTANLYFPCVSTCYEYLKTNVGSDDVFVKSMATNMLPKFEKYWKDFSLILGQ